MFLFRYVCVLFSLVLLETRGVRLTDRVMRALNYLYRTSEPKKHHLDHFIETPKEPSNASPEVFTKSTEDFTKMPKEDMESGEELKEPEPAGNAVFNISRSFFHDLQNYHVKAKDINDINYPWIARVEHSLPGEHPHKCTALCVDKRIFITSAKCLIYLKVDYTKIIYRNKIFDVLTFVLPTNETRHLYEDIGFIVVTRPKVKITWSIASLWNKVNRTDDQYQWFENLGIPHNVSRYTVVGYTKRKGHNPSSKRPYDLTTLDVFIDINMCSTVYPLIEELSGGFHAPCYHSCDLEHFIQNDTSCAPYHGAVGGAVIDSKTSQVLGIATWGSEAYEYELPVGFTVLNSRSFFEDLSCATIIRDDNTRNIETGHYQHMCD